MCWLGVVVVVVAAAVVVVVCVKVNARAQVTSWEPVSSPTTTKIPGLYDYANKAWGGLVGPYYLRRYALYVRQALPVFFFVCTRVRVPKIFGLPVLALSVYADLVFTYELKNTLQAEAIVAAQSKGSKSVDMAAYEASLAHLAYEFQYETHWSNSSTTEPAEPVGDVVAISRELWKKYAPTQAEQH